MGGASISVSVSVICSCVSVVFTVLSSYSTNASPKVAELHVISPKQYHHNTDLTIPDFFFKSSSSKPSTLWFSPWELESSLKAGFAGLFTELRGTLCDFCDVQVNECSCQESSAILMFYSWGFVASDSGSTIGSKVIFCLWLQATKHGILVLQNIWRWMHLCFKGHCQWRPKKGRVFRTTWSLFFFKPKGYHDWKCVLNWSQDRKGILWEFWLYLNGYEIISSVSSCSGT